MKKFFKLFFNSKNWIILILFIISSSLNAQDKIQDKYSFEDLRSFLYSTDPDQYVEKKFLSEYLFYAINLYGKQPDSKLEVAVSKIYFRALSELNFQVRRNIYDVTVERVGNLKTGVIALLPFITIENNRALVSQAVIDYLMYRPVEQIGSLDGAKEMIMIFENFPYVNRGAILGGLLLTGDNRVIELLYPLIPEINDSGVISECVKTQSSYIYFGVIDFFLTWLDYLNQPAMKENFGGVAAVLSNMLTKNKDGKVMEVYRDYGLQSGGPPLVRLKEVSITEYYEENSIRFERLAKAELEPKIMNIVIEKWENYSKY